MASRMIYTLFDEDDPTTLTTSGRRALLALMTTVLLIPLATWCLSIVKSQAVTPNSGKEPPVAPYVLPYFQHMIGFLRNQDGLWQKSRNRYGTSPFSLMMLNTKFHIFGSGATAQSVFGRSRDFSFEPVLESMFSNGMALPEEDLHWFRVPFERKSSTALRKGGAGGNSTELESQVYMDSNHHIWVKYLSGQWLDKIMSVYLGQFHQCLDHVVDTARFEGGKWVDVDLNEAMQRIVFETSSSTFFGPRLAKVWGKNMWEDFKAFNDATYIGMRFAPIFNMWPKAGKGRERMLKAFEEWIEDGKLPEMENVEETWTEEWGFTMNIERQKLAQMFGFTLRGQAALHAAFLFVIIVNAAPLAISTLLSIATSPARLTRFRKEIHKYLEPVDSSRHPDDLRFDMNALQANPFIHGVWNEAIRLGTQSAAARVVTRDTELEGYLLRQGSVVLLPSRLLHFDEDVYEDPYDFMPERWMDPDESDAPIPKGVEDGGEKLTRKVEFEARQKRQRANLRSFGGGKSLCSGRHVAEKEILCLVSTMLLRFDFEIEETGAVQGKGVGVDPEIKLNPRSLGMMGPMGHVKARMKRRKHPHIL